MLFLMGCLPAIEDPEPIAIFSADYEKVVVPRTTCAYEPLPLNNSMQYCVTYDNVECCIWESWDQSFECSYEWCFYWDTCNWEHLQSECLW